MSYSSAVTISNRSSADVPLFLEPWGDFVVVPAGGEIRVVAEAAERGDFEVEYGGDRVTLWVWPTATIRCHLAGQEVAVGAFRRQPVPGVPPGHTTASFLRGILGQ